MLMVPMIPPFGGITLHGMTMLGIFLGTIYGWIVSDVIWPSFLALVMLVLSADHASSVSALLSTVLQNSTIATGIASLFLISIVVLTGLTDWIGRWFLSRPIIKGRPVMMIVLIFVAGLVVCPFSSIAWIMFMCEIIGTINRNLGYEDKSRFSQIMLFSIALNAICVLYLPTQPLWITFEGIISGIIPGFAFGVYPMSLMGLLFSLMFGSANFLALKLVFRLDLSGLKDEKIAESILPPPPMNKRQKISLTMLLTYLLLLMLSSMLPAQWAVVAALKKLGMVGFALILVILSLVIQVDGKPLVSFQAITSHMSWSLIFMMGTSVFLASSLTAPETGITAALSDALVPLFAGFSPYSFTLVIVLVAMLLTNLINNLVVLSISIPVVMAVGPTVGVNVNVVFVLVCYAVNMAIMFPSASIMAALIHSNTKQMESIEIIKFSMVNLVTSALVFAVVGIPLANFFY